jgi:hypothetical protein
MGRGVFVMLCVLVRATTLSAEVTAVTITSQSVVAGGQSFGSTGPYQRLLGRIGFALDPDDPHNVGIVDLNHARRDADSRVRFSSDLYVLRPADPSKGNGVLLFEVPNRGRRGLLGRFNRAERPGNDPTTDPDFGDGLLMREGYTLVWVGWEVDVPAPLSESMHRRRCCRRVRKIGSASRSCTTSGSPRCSSWTIQRAVRR